jgi:hypothetical protein
MPVNASRLRLYPRFVRVVARPKFVGRRVDVLGEVTVPVACMGALGRTESLLDSEDVSFDEDSVGTCRSDSEFSVAVGNGTPLDAVLLKGGHKLAETVGCWSLKSIPTMNYAWCRKERSEERLNCPYLESERIPATTHEQDTLH